MKNGLKKLNKDFNTKKMIILKTVILVLISGLKKVKFVIKKMKLIIQEIVYLILKIQMKILL